MEIRSRDLKVYCVVVDAGSLQAAAARVGLSASAISRIISQLEFDLGVELFDRRERRLIPTPAGREFYGRAREALLLWEELAVFGRSRAGRAKQPLRVAALSRHAETIVSPAIADLLLKTPEPLPVQIELHAQRDFGFSRLARPFDIGFGHLVVALDDLELITLTHSRIVVIASISHPLSDRRLIEPAELADHRLIQLSRDTIIGALVRQVLTDGGSLNVTAEVSHTHLALRMVQAGLGLHVTDELAALTAQDNGCRLIPLRTDHAVSFAAFWPKRASGLSADTRAAYSAVVKTLQTRGAKIERDAMGLLNRV